jgi:hypothetical protein
VRAGVVVRGGGARWGGQAWIGREHRAVVGAEPDWSRCATRKPSGASSTRSRTRKGRPRPPGCSARRRRTSRPVRQRPRVARGIHSAPSTRGTTDVPSMAWSRRQGWLPWETTMSPAAVRRRTSPPDGARRDAAGDSRTRLSPGARSSRTNVSAPAGTGMRVRALCPEVLGEVRGDHPLPPAPAPPTPGRTPPPGPAALAPCGPRSAPPPASATPCTHSLRRPGRPHAHVPSSTPRPHRAPAAAQPAPAWTPSAPP